MNKDHFAIIMAGGVGSRFWPLSTKKTPKQFLDIVGTGKSLIKETYDRFCAICPEENILIVTNQNYIDQVCTHIPTIKKSQILAEPMGKNTAPCVAYAAARVKAMNPKGVMVVAPSDHVIGDEELFREIIYKSYDRASQSNELITLGIKPTRPDTGYGYINFDATNVESGFNKVIQFTEKPHLAKAKEFVSAGTYLWNAGIFVWSADAILDELNQYQPELMELINTKQSDFNTNNEVRAVQFVYDNCESISIDYAILEKSSNVRVYPSGFSWNDIGTWNALYDYRDKNADNNVLTGNSLFIKNTTNSIIHQEGDKLIAIHGLKDIIVVDSGKVILIADRNDEQAIKTMVTELKSASDKDYT